MVIIMLIITRMAKKNGDLFSLASVTTLILVSYVQRRTITSLFLHFFFKDYVTEKEHGVFFVFVSLFFAEFL